MSERRCFHVGDRVAVYQSGKRRVGAVDGILVGNCLIRVHTEVGHMDVHPKQCRRLRKRAGRRLWIYRDLLSQQDATFRWAPPDHSHDQWIEFREVRKPKERKP